MRWNPRCAKHPNDLTSLNDWRPWSTEGLDSSLTLKSCLPSASEIADSSSGCNFSPESGLLKKSGVPIDGGIRWNYLRGIGQEGTKYSFVECAKWHSPDLSLCYVWEMRFVSERIKHPI